MRAYKDWKDYELIDCSDGERLERWGDIVLVRPDETKPAVQLRLPQLALPRPASDMENSEGASALGNSARRL